MLSYERFKQLWQDENLDAETFLLSTYWTSVFSEKELHFVLQVILKSKETNTFAEFLKAIDLLPSEFSEMFGLGIDRVDEWIARKTIFPERLKSRYVFELITNEIEKMRRRVCVRCGEHFLSREESDFCDSCKREEMAEIAKVEKKGVIIQIEVTI